VQGEGNDVRKTIFLLAAMASLLTQGCAAHRMQVRDSFLQVLKTVDISACGRNAQNEEEARCAVFVQLNGVGSGSIVHNERTIGGAPRTLVMTADHVCHDNRQITQDSVPPPVLEMFKKANGITGDLTFMVSRVDLKLKDSRGTIFGTRPEPWLRNAEADVCIVESSINQRAIPIAGSEPEYGEDIINISAPYGLMFTNASGGAVYITEGRYSGSFAMSHAGVRNMYTIWTAPGSSGSPIINERGEIIGMVSAISMITWPRLAPRGIGVVSAPSNITFGPTLVQVRYSVNEAIAAMRRGKPMVYASTVEPEGAAESTGGTSGELLFDVPPIGSDQYLFPYQYDFEWR